MAPLTAPASPQQQAQTAVTMSALLGKRRLLLTTAEQ